MFHVVLRLLEIARVLVRFNHVARFNVNGESQHQVSGCVAERIPIALLAAFGPSYPEPTEWQRIGDYIDATLVFARGRTS